MRETALFSYGFTVDPYSVDENGSRKRYLDKVVPVGAVYAMNAPSQELYKPMFFSIGNYINHIFGHYEAVYSCNTYQFKDYDRYDVNLFPVELKAQQRKKQFPKDLDAAYQMGKNLVNQIAL